MNIFTNCKISPPLCYKTAKRYTLQGGGRGRGVRSLDPRNLRFSRVVPPLNYTFSHVPSVRLDVLMTKMNHQWSLVQ